MRIVCISQEMDIKLRRDVTQSWDFILRGSSGQQNTLRRKLQLFYSIEPNSLDKTTLYLQKHIFINYMGICKRSDAKEMLFLWLKMSGIFQKYNSETVGFTP